MILIIQSAFSFQDVFFLPIYIIVLIALCYSFSPKEKHLIKYFRRGFLLKILGAVFFWLVYNFIYDGGDTWSYFYSSKAIGNLILVKFSRGVEVLLGIIDNEESLVWFRPSTGWPKFYMAKDYYTFTVCRYAAIFYLLSGKSFIISTILHAAFSYIGLWKLYKVVNYSFPNNEKTLFYLILAMPSIIFWTGGIMKDTYVFNATCWIVYNLYSIFVFKRKRVLNIIVLIFNVIIILNIKAYLLISLIPAVLIWLNNTFLKKVRSSFLKAIIAPLTILLLSGAGLFLFQNISSSMGQYGDIESTINQAQVIQQDLLREEQYGGNNYNIGQLDGTFSGMLKIAPMSIFTALYRPLPWEYGSPLMVLSIIENCILLFFTFILLTRLRPYKLFKEIFSEPFFLFSIIFSVFFAFGVGIASTNFGALVRYKLPLMPFFFTTLYLIYNKTKKVKN